MQSTSPIPTSPAPPPTHWPSAAQLGLSLLAAATLLLVALLILVIGLLQLGQPISPGADTAQLFLLAAGLGLAGTLTLPSAWYAARRLFGRARPGVPGPQPPQTAHRRAWLVSTALCIVLLPLAVLLGDQIARRAELGWLLAPFHLLAIGLPVLWLALLGLRGLPSGSPQRAWGVFASGLVIGPFLILVLELVMITGLLILWAIWVASQPELSAEFADLVQRLQYAPPNEEVILRILSPYLMRPATLFAILFVAAGVVPLMEETLKPIGIWLLAGRRLTPAEGFSAGILSGAGFALFENLGNTSLGGEGWSTLVIVRISTVLLHMLTTGLTGWALASAWSEKRYLRLGITFSIAVALHGLWNSMAVLSAAAIQLPEPLSLPPAYQTLGYAATGGLLILLFTNLSIYLGFNRALRRSLPALPPATAPEN